MTSEKLYCFTCERWIPPVWWERHMASIRHRNCVLGIPPPPFTWKISQPDDDDEPDALDEPDTRAQCGGCSRRITPGSEYHRDDGKAYHNNCVPLTTTRPLNPLPTAQDAHQQAGKLLAGVGVQVGTGRPQNG